IGINTTDTDGDGLTDCEETTGIDDPSTPDAPSDFGVTPGNPSDANDACDPIGINTTDSDNDGLTDCEETTGIDDPSTPDAPSDFGVTPGNPSDANDACDPITSGCQASIEVTKTAMVFGTELGDIIEYTIEVENTGDIVLTDISLVDTFTDAYGNTISLTQDPVFDNADQGSSEGTLLAGEIATYYASFTITQLAIDAGGVSNSVVVNGFARSSGSVSDISDDGDDSDNNAFDDPTFTELGCLTVINEFSPNDDGKQDTLEIRCIDNYPNNRLEVYNRWGNIVYEKRGYNSNDEWDGTSNGRVTINSSEKLPIGTYYYILDLGDGSKPKAGWLYINR
ncbi:gliding motility-associated C-terminal domain-containing protein, partial [uncultured Algibacter sp.]|uniref:T9SS type B sorting domain-containing protein n=1 Tax=uncultured Algibacter sp. TaxID=298659 RepID=UPI00262D960B